MENPDFADVRLNSAYVKFKFGAFCVILEGTGWLVPHPTRTRLTSLPKEMSLMPELASQGEFWIFPPKCCVACQCKDCARFTVLSDL